MPLEFRGVAELAKTFGVIPGELRTAIKPKVLEAADLIRDTAESNASWSPEIAASIVAEASFSGSGGGAIVRVPERGFPHAGEVRTYEGNGVSPTRSVIPCSAITNAGLTDMTHPFLGTRRSRTSATRPPRSSPPLSLPVIASNGL
jgi:hypothetical protein